jgi:uncharacterized membrane protein YhhN
MGLPLFVFSPLATGYLFLKTYEQFVLNGMRLLPVYVDVIIKILPIVTLLIWTLASDDVEVGFRMGLGLALVFSMGGDLFMELNHFKHHFLFGLGSFLIAHILYTSAFVGKPKCGIFRGLGAIAASAAIYYCADLFYENAPSQLATPVLVYCTIIWIMTISAILCAPVQHSGLAALGAITFAASDAVIGAEKFVWGGHVVGAKVFIMFTYYAAQYMLSHSFEIDYNTIINNKRR